MFTFQCRIWCGMLSGPSNWIIKSFHQCPGYDMSPKLTASNFADCISKCEGITNCVGVVFDDADDENNCSPKRNCFGRDRYFSKTLHTAYVSKYHASKNIWNMASFIVYIELHV